MHFIKTASSHSLRRFISLKFDLNLKQLAPRKKQLTTHDFISNWQNKFATRIKELASRKFIFLKSQIATRN